MTDPVDLERLWALLSIGQLPSQYAFAVDSRNLDDLVALYVDDVTRPDMDGSGRHALREHFEPVLRSYYRTMHQMLGHQIDLVDADHATGKVYCRAEHEIGDNGWSSRCATSTITSAAMAIASSRSERSACSTATGRAIDPRRHSFAAGRSRT